MNLNLNNNSRHSAEEIAIAIRTAFISKFVVLREGKRSKAHRDIERLTWSRNATAEDLCHAIRELFKLNGDKLSTVDRDLKRALQHAHGSASFFIPQYISRQTLSFKEALEDYERSNELLFGSEESPVTKRTGWRLSNQLQS